MTILVADAFTAANGTAINGRTPDTTVSSRTWTAGSWRAGSLSGTVDIQNNQANISTADQGFSIDIGVADFIATWYVTTPSSLATAFRGGLCFRAPFNVNGYATSTDRDYYFFVVRFDLASAQLRLIKTVDDTESDIGTNVTYAFSTSTTYKIALKAEGSTYTIYVNDAQQKQDTDSTYTTQTILGARAGVLGQNLVYDSVEFATIGGTVLRRIDNDRAGSRS